MIGERLKQAHYNRNVLEGLKAAEKKRRIARALEHYEEIITHGENRKVWELERTEEGGKRIRKVRL